MGRGYCAVCERYCQTERHHVFAGSLRPISEEYGAVVDLCHEHHQGNSGVHKNAGLWAAIKVETQKRVMIEQGWNVEQWRAEFGKNYLDADELEEVAAAIEDNDGGCFTLTDEEVDFYAWTGL